MFLETVPIEFPVTLPSDVFFKQRWLCQLLTGNQLDVSAGRMGADKDQGLRGNFKTGEEQFLNLFSTHQGGEIIKI